MEKNALKSSNLTKIAINQISKHIYSNLDSRIQFNWQISKKVSAYFTL